MKPLTWLSAVPFIRHRLYRGLRHDIEDGFTRDRSVIIFFADQYFLRNPDAISDTVATWNPGWEVGFITIHTGNGMQTVFFVGKTFQDLWDGLSLYKNALANRWLGFHIEVYMNVLRREAQRRGLIFQDDEILP
jgi:hypothetical protein